MSLIEQLGKAAFSQMTRNASTKTGLNESAIAALMPMATAMLMNGLKKNVAKPGGAEALSKALAQHDGSLLGNLSRTGDDDVMADGRAILGHILGGKQGQAQASLAKAAGANSDQIGNLLAMAAPAILAGLGKATREQGLDASALAQLVTTESKNAETAATNELGGLLKWLDTDGDGRIIAACQKTMSAATTPSKGLLHWGSQYGEAKNVIGWRANRHVSRVVAPFDRQLRLNAAAYDGKSYFKTLMSLNITWRVAGEADDFDGGEGPERMRYWRKDHFIGIDMVIPLKAWENRTNPQILDYILTQLRASFDLLLKRAIKEKELVDEAGLRADIEQLLRDYERDCREKLCSDN